VSAENLVASTLRWPGAAARVHAGACGLGRRRRRAGAPRPRRVAFFLASCAPRGEDFRRRTSMCPGEGCDMTTRREFMVGGAAVLATTELGPPAFAQWRPSERYPDPAVELLDPSFAKYRLALASVERLAIGMRWSEGPAWFGAGRYLVWSDIPNNRIMRWQEENGAVSVFRQPSNNANGNTRDRQGRLVTCEHDTRRLTRTEFDGTITTLIDKFDGKPLNSPNDVVVKSDDSIWFTDPPFGILGNYEGHVATPELPTNVYRLDPGSGRATVAAGDVNRPNGLAFSPDESKLYIVEAG